MNVSLETSLSEKGSKSELKNRENPTYVLITPARNEEKCIAKTIESVINQTIQPLFYVIVSDSSTDKTDSIVLSYESKYPFVKLIRFEKNKKANFCSKVFAFNAGLALVREKIKHYEFVGNLDADVSFEKDYFEQLLRVFISEPELGIAGGQVFEDHSGKLVRHRNSNYSVAGAVMLFRKACYESVGGYVPIEIGGEDSATENTARARGWKVRTITDLKVMHNKPCLSGNNNYFQSKFKQGLSNYMIGYHPLFQFAVCIYRIIDKPFLLSGVAMGAGYIWGAVTRKKRSLQRDVISYMRKEQILRLFPFLKRYWK